MANCISLRVLAWIFCCGVISLSYAFTDHNLIKVIESDGQQRLDSSVNDLSMIDVFHHQDVISFVHLPLSKTIEAIYQFGDSISDTGNVIQERPLCDYAKFPYGETFFHKPTGRCSNGLLMIDYFTKFFNLSFLDPYLDKHGNFTHGVNFAVAGATALNNSILVTKNILSCPTNSSLLVQLDWFKTHLNSICSSASERKEKLEKALVMMGEIGGNDYNFAFFDNKELARIYEMVPEVVQTIKIAIKEVIDLGVIHLVVPGNFPIGCMTVYLNMFKTNDSKMYDELQCLSYLNDHAKFHNNKLKGVIRELQKEYPNVSIIYADYFVAFREILRQATSLGFDNNIMEKACCSMCGGYGNSICENPDKYISWDGMHLTQHAYQIMADWLIKKISHDKSFTINLQVRFQMPYIYVLVMIVVGLVCCV